MILAIDTDEFVTRIDLEELDELIQKHPKSIGLIERMDYFENGGVRRVQVFHADRLFNRKYYEYLNPIHECLFAKEHIDYDNYQAPITVDHVGYLGSKEELDAKALRDIELLQKELSEDPDNPYIYFQIGQSYLMMRDEVNSLTSARQRHCSLLLRANTLEYWSRISAKYS